MENTAPAVRGDSSPSVTTRDHGTTTMSTQALQDFVFTSKYGRYNAALKRRETFEESVDRVMEMHARKFTGKDIAEELDFCRGAMKDRLVLGSQRALQFGGDPIIKKEARIYNCTVSYCDRPRFFQECFWLLLCGCGTGFSVQRHHIEKLPPLYYSASSHVPDPTTFSIPDSIEGWSNALGILLASYGIAAPEFKPWIGLNVAFDYSQIRAKGAQLSSGNGKAPGSAPLAAALEKIRTLLSECRHRGQTHLAPIDAYDIVMHASDAVLSGGVRRSATICVFSVDDERMIAAKTGDWFMKNPQRGRSNNSALLLRDGTSWETFNGLMKSVKEFGEPGFVWADSTEILYNPCVEIGLYPQIDGQSGWAFCNLCEINMKACVDEATWTRACKAAAILGTLQAGYTSFPYLGEVSEQIAAREALLGCSMTGMMDNPKIAFDPDMQRRMAKLILNVNEAFAYKLGVNPTARATCVKPAGTTSCILGTSSGIHAHHAKRYFRRVQANDLESPLQYFKLHNPRHVERSVWSANGTDQVVTFCVKTGDEALTKATVGALEQLEYVKLTQNNWVEAGRVADRCAAPFLRHNVSNTISVKDNEWDSVAVYIFSNRESFAGISLLPFSGDRDYPQAPFCQVYSPAEIVEMYGDGSIMASGLIVDGLHAFSDNLWAACDTALGIGEVIDVDRLRRQIAYDCGLNNCAQWQAEGVTPTSPDKLLGMWLSSNVPNFHMKVDWVRRAKQFAVRYFEGDIKRMTYCLKDTNNFKLWVDLNREYQAVDWSLLVEEKDDTANVVLDAACAGGACALG